MLHVRTVGRPHPGPGQALVRVLASSVNPLDTIVRSGQLRLLAGRRFPRRTGIDFVGEVVALGPDASNAAPSNAAEFVTIATTRIARSPVGLNPIEAAAISIVGAVAIITLRDKAKLRPGGRLLVRGAAGGVGSIAVQLGALLGAHVTALASAGDLEFVRALGADEARDYRTTTPAALAGRGAFDVVLDLVGTALGAYRALLSRHGRMFCLPVKSGGAMSYILASAVYGATRVRFFSAAPMHDTMADLTGYVEAGSLRPVVHSVFPLDDIAAAQRSLEAGGGRGKRVLDHTA